MKVSNRNKLFVFGDSHSIIWEGSELPNRETPPYYSDVVVHHLGPALAWNINDKWRSQIFGTLNDLEDKPDTIFLSFGEIDVRTGRPSLNVAAARLVAFACDASYVIGSRVVILSPPPTATYIGNEDDPAYPCSGSSMERNERARNFCREIEQHVHSSLREYRIDFIDTHKILLPTLDEMRDDIFCDGRHLNRKALSEIIATLQDTPYAKYFSNTRDKMEIA